MTREADKKYWLFASAKSQFFLAFSQQWEYNLQGCKKGGRKELPR
jgi:hypothetical protein